MRYSNTCEIATVGTYTKQCQYYGDKWSGRKGGNGGSEHEFKLDDDERIIRVQGRAAERIDQLQFFTNKGSETTALGCHSDIITDTMTLGRSSEIFGGSGGSAFVWTPPFMGDNNASDTNMSLLCFQGACGNEVDRLAPVWAVNPPVSWKLDIKEFDEPLLGKKGKPESAWTSEQTVENWTDAETKGKVSFQGQTSKTTTVSVSDESRSQIGGKVSMEVSVKGKAGVPLVADGEVEAKAGIEVSYEHGWGRSVTDSSALSYTFTESHEMEVPIAAQKRVRVTATAYRTAVEGLNWRGEMLITYAGGGKKSFPVNGTFDSATTSKVSFAIKSEEVQ